MSQLQINAVGSNLFIANEIATICKSILGQSFTINTLISSDIPLSIPSNQIFICSNTQHQILQKKIPQEKLILFDLKPTTNFFLTISKIPNNKTIYIFNNLSPYIHQLEKECKIILDNENLHFEGIPYEELPLDEILKKLKSAEYIVGASPFLESEGVLYTKFKNFLSPNVSIISGKRFPSIKSSCILLEHICDVYIENIKSNNPQWLKETPMVVDTIRIAIELIITNQIILSDYQQNIPLIKSNMATFTSIEELKFLRKKISTLII